MPPEPDFPPSVPAQPPRERRWLRGLMVLVLGGGLGHVVHRAKVQRAAVDAIERVGGEVQYRWQNFSRSARIPIEQPNALRWLVVSVGLDYFGPMVSAIMDRVIEADSSSADGIGQESLGSVPTTPRWPSSLGYHACRISTSSAPRLPTTVSPGSPP